ncbi:MAG: hypothetical protein P9L99_11925 [Candidatus Lernaella stagnicola]|nr:hypothetical protein [Candidatus Lernaella stagnicola]
MQMRRYFLLFCVLVLVAAFAGCSSCGKKKEAASAGFTAGPATADELVQKYVASIVKKDPELLKETLLTEDDFATLQKGQGRKYWQAYFMMTKRAFMDKNKDLLGRQVELAGYTLGREIARREGVVVYRGTEITLKTTDGKEFKTEINFIMEAGGRWKIFGLKYLSDGLKRRGVLKNMGIFEGDPKFKGVDGAKDVNIKIKKVTKQPEEEQPETSEDDATPGP